MSKKLRFRGKSECKLDDKGRIIIPAQFRRNVSAEAKRTFIITRGTRGCLYAYPLNEWVKIEESLEALPENRENSELKSCLNEFMVQSTYDRQGRINLSKELIEMAKLKRDVVLIGVGRMIEIWNPEVRGNVRKRGDKAMDEAYYQAINMAKNLGQQGE